MKTNNVLNGLHIIVIGAGPGGLTFAKAACAQGADVKILEQAGYPRGKDAGYTDRSFNLTLNSVGRTVLGDKRAWKGSTDLVGRAIHKFHGGEDTKYSNPAQDDSAILTSVPRPVLRQNMVKLVEEQGVEIKFRTEVLNIEPNTGAVLVKKGDGTKETLSSDLVVVADGLHSLADKMVEALPKGSLNMRVEHLNYMTVSLSKRVSEGLSLHHIHFWHQPEAKSVAIGLPNKDGTIAVLLVSSFDNVAADISPFATKELAVARLKSDFPQLLALDPTLVTQVIGRKRGCFYYKSITDNILGRRCVVIGDASSASPPWAGFGANTAIYSADALVRFMIGVNGNIDTALSGYQQHKRILAELVLKYADEHGEFLNKKVAENPNERPVGPVLGQLINTAVQKSQIPKGVELLSF